MTGFDFDLECQWNTDIAILEKCVSYLKTFSPSYSSYYNRIVDPYLEIMGQAVEQMRRLLSRFS